MATVIGTETRFVIQRADGRFFQQGFDCADAWVKNPLLASDVSGALYLKDAKITDEGEVVEVKVSACLTGKKEADLYHMGEQMIGEKWTVRVTRDSDDEYADVEVYAEDWDRAKAKAIGAVKGDPDVWFGPPDAPQYVVKAVDNDEDMARS